MTTRFCSDNIKNTTKKQSSPMQLTSVLEQTLKIVIFPADTTAVPLNVQLTSNRTGEEL